MDHVTCGSAHSVAWSSIRRKIVCQLPDKIPMEFNHLQTFTMAVLRNRLILLHHFSQLFCKSLPLFGVHDGTFEGFDKLRCILLSHAKVSHNGCVDHQRRAVHTSNAQLAFYVCCMLYCGLCSYKLIRCLYNYESTDQYIL